VAVKREIHRVPITDPFLSARAAIQHATGDRRPRRPVRQNLPKARAAGNQHLKPPKEPRTPTPGANTPRDHATVPRAAQPEQRAALADLVAAADEDPEFI